jgi:4-diphosphocytidyl-2-C-methyl-D-erythritol kinase
MKSLYDVSAPAKAQPVLCTSWVGVSDGYHLLESVFRLIDWCDTLHFETPPPMARSAGKT